MTDIIVDLLHYLKPTDTLCEIRSCGSALKHGGFLFKDVIPAFLSLDLTEAHASKLV